MRKLSASLAIVICTVTVILCSISILHDMIVQGNSGGADTILEPRSMNLEIIGGCSITKKITVTNNGAAGTYQITYMVFPDSEGIDVTVPTSVYVASGSSKTIDFVIKADFHLMPGIYEIVLEFSKSGGTETTRTSVRTTYVVPNSNEDIPLPGGSNTNRYLLTISYNGCGHVEQTPWMETYPENTIVSLQATPCPNYKFDHFEGYGDESIISITMDGNKNIGVYFTYSPDAETASMPYQLFIALGTLACISGVIYLYHRKKEKR